MTTKADLEASNRSGGRHFGYVDIVVPPAPPFVMFVNGGDCTVTSKFLEQGSFEPSSLGLWARFAALATSIFDVGAHAGIYSLVAALLRPDLQIQAFEPNPDAYARLIVNITANGVTNIVPHRAGVGAQEGHFQLAWVTKRLGHLSSGARYIDERTSTEGGTSVLARMLRLDSLLETLEPGKRPLVKIDVEGQEEGVFVGMSKLLAHRPDIILETFRADVCQRLTEMTKPLGYHYHQIDEAGSRLVERSELQPGTLEAMNQFLTTHDINRR